MEGNRGRYTAGVGVAARGSRRSRQRGSRADIEFYRVFLGDLEQAVGEAMANIPWGTGVDPSVNAHTAYLPAWLDAIGVQATEALREKYGDYYGFEAATPPNAAMVATAMLFYR